MATDLTFIKTAGGQLAPADQHALEYVAKLPLGRPVLVNIIKHRNPAFHRKFFALLNLAYESWEPVDTQFKGERVQKNFEQFRNDVTVLAGHYDTTVTLRGDVRLVAKSISFGRMSQDEFEVLYSSVCNVILSRILTRYTRDDLDTVIEKILGFV